MDFYSLVKKTRSFRRFDESRRIDEHDLIQLVDTARFAPTGANKQPLKFIIVKSPEKCNMLFPSTAWAGYLKDWAGPVKGERPVAYIILLGDNNAGSGFLTDLGIAAQTVVLAAAEKDIGACMIASIRREDIRRDFQIEERYEVLLVIALGYPVEKVVIEEVADGNIKYWRDKDEVHHVPKRSLDELILKIE